MQQQTEVPAGYMKDAQDRLVPVDMVKPVDKARDKLVLSLMKRAEAERGKLTALRDDSTDKVHAFIEKVAKKYGTKLGGAKGNISLVSYDGHSKVVISIGQETTFSESIHVAKKLIDECLMEWSEGAKPELRVLVDQAFQMTDDGSYAAARILELRKLKIKDVKWNRAMRALNESITVGQRKPYLRFYKRLENGEWDHLALDISRLPAKAA